MASPIRLLRLNLIDKGILSAYNPTKEILAVKHTTTGPRIARLLRNEVTCWQMFLRFFGYGSLAGTDVHLDKVVAHLNRYNWQEITASRTESSSPYYLKVCDIANKALFHKNITSLYEKVSPRDGNIGVLIIRRPLSRAHIIHMRWNVRIQVRHLVALAARTVNIVCTPMITTTGMNTHTNACLDPNKVLDFSDFQNFKVHIHDNDRSA